MTRIVIVLACALVVASTGGGAEAQSLCDVDGDNRVTDVDDVNVLRAAAALPSSCTLATCDVDGDGTISDIDGVHVLRAAAGLPSVCPALADVIVLSPASTTLTVGESRFYTATAPAEDGGTVNVTQQVDYVSSDTAVAQAPNAPGVKSEIIAVGPGVATISAQDPMSGLTSTPGGDATLMVLGALEGITLTPESTTLTVGESRFYTATGNFAGGGTLNLTQQLDYASSDEAVAVAANAPGLRSQVAAVGPGEATISARDTETGVVSNGATLTVLGALRSIALTPESATRAIGVAIFYTANGNFAGGGTSNRTQRVDYASSDEAVAMASNAPGVKSRVDPVGEGETTISARDPKTGITSNAAMLTVVR